MGANFSETIDYEGIISNQSWLFEKDRYAIISPDVDGILCGLFMSYFFNWKIVGYYDGKNIVIKKNIRPSDCVFLDMEIFREHYRSIGQHMLMYSRKMHKDEGKWKEFSKNYSRNFSKCINPNNIRGYDAKDVSVLP